jgi:hypothetical protein
MFQFQGFELRKIARSARTRSINARQAASGNGQQHEMFSTVPAPGKLKEIRMLTHSSSRLIEEKKHDCFMKGIPKIIQNTTILFYILNCMQAEKGNFI